MDQHEQAQSNVNAHGRGESRLVMQLQIKLPQELKEKWPHVKTVIEVTRGRKFGEKTSYISHFYLNSLPIELETKWQK